MGCGLPRRVGGRCFSCGSAACPCAALGPPGAWPDQTRESSRGRRRLLPVGRTRRRRSSSGGDREWRGRGRPSTGVAPDSHRFVPACVGTLYGIRDRRLSCAYSPDSLRRGEMENESPQARRLCGSGFELLQSRVRADRLRSRRCGATALLLYVPSSSLAPSGKLFISGVRQVDSLLTGLTISRVLVRVERGVVADPHDEGDRTGAAHPLAALAGERVAGPGRGPPQDPRALLAPQECGAAGSSSR
jgi:hypothetical protein